MQADDLLVYLFDGRPHPLAAPLAAWAADSRRFAAFTGTYRDKIRKKVRTNEDAERQRDLLLELEMAYLLLQERHFSVEYEKYTAGKGRGPDFTVTFKGRLLFNVEVAHMRSSTRAPAAETGTAQREAARLAEIVCSKLGQMLPQMINLIVIAADDQSAAQLDLGAALARLKTRAEQHEAQLLSRGGFRDTADFIRAYQRLSAVGLRIASDQPSAPLLWRNPQARPNIPADLHTCLLRLGRTS